MKDCKKIHPLLPFYIEGQLSSSEKAQVEKHLSACETAKAELEHFRHLLVGLKNMPDPPVPADLHEKIMAKLGHNVQPSPVHHGFWGTPAWALAAAAVVVFVLLNQYPDWRDTLRVHNQPQARDEITTPPTASQPSGFAKAMPEKPMEKLAAKKKQSNENIAMNYQVTGALAERKLAKVRKDKEAPMPAEEESSSYAKASEDRAVPATAPVASFAKAEPKAKTMAGASAQTPPAAAPAPRADLNQSLESLTISREQSVIIWNGNSGPSTMENQELVTDAEAFQKYWQIPHPGEIPPAVDFTKEAVVVLNAGQKPTAGYSIHVSRLEEKADQLVIHYRVEAPAPDAVAAQVITHPWALQVIPKPSKPVVFLKDP